MVYLAALLLAMVVIPPLVTSKAWNDPTGNQYHIQTDEGPERYFKYQTQNGQYRKEKRLEDGTVIGTYAWIDGNGYLRQRDYIADGQGYRIVKNKNVFVGNDINIADAMKAAKKVPNNYDQLSRGYVSITPKPIYSVPSVDLSLNSIASTPESVYLPSSTLRPPTVYIPSEMPKVDAYLPPSSTPRPPNIYLPSSTPKPPTVYIPQEPSSVYLPSSTPKPPPVYIPQEPSSVYLPSSTPKPDSIYLPPSTIRPPTIYIPQETPNVYLPPSSTPKPPNVYIPPETPSSVYLPSSTPLPPSQTYLPSSTPKPFTPSRVYLPASTPPPVSYPHISTPLYPPLSNSYIPPSSTPSTLYLPASSPRPFAPPTQSPIYVTSTPGYVKITPPSRKYVPQPEVNSNSLEYAGNDFVNPYIHQNGPTYPLDKNGHSFNPTYNNIGNGYDPQYPYYDGISVTNDGFRYYIPRAYHEEQSNGYDRKSGSFGYIDPFGIRRVVYYNTGPDGFKHRKNNRYVGFDATPYDPRPTY